MKQTFNIPENCNATVEQVGNQIVVTFEPKVKEFKKGDIVALQYINRNYVSCICIYSDKKCWSGINSKGEFMLDGFSNDDDPNIKVKLATPEERQLLFDKLEKKGYRFNEETCEVEKIRWEPKDQELVEFISSCGNIENYVFISSYQDGFYKLGNCFKPNTLNQDKVKRLFAEFIQKVKDEHNIDY